MEVGRLITYSSERYLASMTALRAAYGHEQMNKEATYYQSFGAMVPDSVLCEPGADLRVLGIGSGSGKDAGGKLYYKLWDGFGQGDRLKTSLRTSVDVEQWLDAAGIDYVTSGDGFGFNIDVSECFNEESEAGMKILDFLTQTPYVSNMPEIRSMALEHMRCNSSVVDGKRFYKTENEVFVAYKKGE